MINLVFFPILSLLGVLLYWLGFARYRYAWSILIILNLILAFDSFLYIILYKITFIFNGGEWFHIEGLNVGWGFIFSPLTVTLGFTIIFVASHIMLYSLSYMGDDINSVKFISMISLFTFFMLFGVYSNNLLQLLVGWEGVGIISYLLINFYDNRVEANRSAMKALLVNKVGDMGFLLGIITSFNLLASIKLNSFNFLAYYFKGETILALILKSEFNYLTIIASMFLIAGSAKSAQLFFNIWLPDAMEGPTPVSALLHSATMVGIGFLLLLKLTLFYQTVGYLLNFIMLVGALTSIVTSIAASSCYDVKSINANSTGSQLGFMFLAYGSGGFTASFYHFTTHAFYKALLFLSSGLIIQKWGDIQDGRRINPLSVLYTPTTSTGFFLGTASLVAIPATLGSFSKEYIYTLGYENSFGFTGWFLTFLSSFMTTSYPLSLISAYLDTDTLSSYKKNTFKQLNGSPAGVGYPILSLAIFSLTVTPCLTILFNSVSIYNNPLILNNIKEGSIDYLFTDTYIASLPLASLCCSILAIYQSDLILCDEEGSDDTDKDNKYATYLFLDQAINSFLLKTFWLNYFILFRLVANNALHPYNFVQKVIKVSCFIQVISNRASGNIYLITSFLIYNITIISFLYYYKVYYDIKPPGFVKIEIEIFDEL